MKLKIDTTKKDEVIVQLTSNGKVVDQIKKQQQKGSQALLPAIVKLLKKNKKTFNDLTDIEVNPGPGSFTGTRIGVTVANTLGFLLKIPVNGKKGKIVETIYEESKFDL